MTILMPLCAAVLFGIAAQLLKRFPAGVALSTLCANAVIASAFVVLAVRAGFSWSEVDAATAVMTGVLLFVGQYCSMKAVTHGDPGVAASVLGVKIPLVPLIVWLVYKESPASGVAVGAGVAAVGVFLLNSRSDAKTSERPLRFTIVLAICAAIAFAVFDVMVARAGDNSSGTMAAGLVLSTLLSLVAVVRAGQKIDRTELRNAMTGAGVMGISMLVFILSVWLTTEPAQCNIVFATRGITTMLLGAVIDRNLTGTRYSLTQIFGALGIVAAAIATYFL
jgi:drug/metabolite transporter (DMT)-like permease